MFVVGHNNHCWDLDSREFLQSRLQRAEQSAALSYYCSRLPLVNEPTTSDCLFVLSVCDCYLMQCIYGCESVCVCEIPDRSRWVLVICPAGQFVRAGTTEEQWGTEVNST